MRVTVLFTALLLAFQIGFSQDIQLTPTVIASGGGYAESGEISLSWTLGEIAVTTLSQGEITLTQGFQQSFFKGTGFQPNPINWNARAYPNPVQSELFLEFSMPDQQDLLMELQDLSGKLLSQMKYEEVASGDVISVNMSSYVTGMYFLRVSTTDRAQVRIFSIKKD